MPLFFDNKLYKITKEDNRTYLQRKNTNLGNNDVYQWFYKTVLSYAVMYAAPLLILAVLTGFLLRALAKAKRVRTKMTSNNVSIIFMFSPLQCK